MNFERIYLLHGKGGSPDGTVKELQNAIAPLLNSDCAFVRPLLPHRMRLKSAEESVDYLRGLDIPIGSLLVGVSLGGLVAAKLQEDSRPDLHVILISSPTWADGLLLRDRMENRVVFYSSNDAVIEGRTGNWPILSRAYDLSWLTHDSGLHVLGLAQLVAAYVNGDELDEVVKSM